MVLDPLPVLLAEFTGPKRKLRLSTAFALHMSGRALLEVQSQGRVSALQAAVQQGLTRLATQLKVALERSPQTALASGVYSSSRRVLEQAAASVRWDVDLRSLAQHQLDEASRRLGQRTTRKAAMTFQHPWAAGQQLLRAAYDVGLLVGIDILSQAATMRPVAHVYDALLKTGLLPAIPVLDELVAWLHNYLFVGGALPAERARSRRSSCSPSASRRRPSRPTTRRAAPRPPPRPTRAPASTSATGSSANRLRGRPQPAQAAATASAAARSRRGRSCRAGPT